MNSEIEELRAKLAAICPPRSLLEAHEYDRLMWRLFALQDRERGPVKKKRRGRKPRPAYTHWTLSSERLDRKPTVEDKLSREAARRIAHVLGSP